jgi:ABC-type sugar transport system substrate-binding protein
MPDTVPVVADVPAVPKAPGLTAWIVAHYDSLSPRVKALGGAALLAAASLSIPDAKVWITSNLGQHPKLTAWATTLIFIVGLYQKPFVQQIVDGALKVKKTSPTTAEVSIEPKV